MKILSEALMPPSIQRTWTTRDPCLLTGTVTLQELVLQPLTQGRHESGLPKLRGPRLADTTPNGYLFLEGSAVLVSGMLGVPQRQLLDWAV